MMGACARNMYSDSAEIKPAQCCIKLVFHLTYTMMHGSTKLKFRETKISLCRGGRSQDLPDTDFYPAIWQLKYLRQQYTHSKIIHMR